MKDLYKVCICGIGYVGLTLAAIMADSGFAVTGVEIKPEIVESLNQGQPHFHENGLKDILKSHLNRNLKITTTIPNEPFEAFIITAGTPLKNNVKEPELKHIVNITNDIVDHLEDGGLVILRSTVSIGTTRKVVLPLLQKKCPNVNIAFCPERTIEGKALKELRILPQIIGGLNKESVALASDIFHKITPSIIQVSSLETAEMVKLLDNAYRDLNFAFANEVANICEHIGIDAMEAITAGKTGYPRTSIPYPGFVGGACLEKDPHILTYSSSKYGYFPLITKNAREINELLPVLVLNRVEKLMEYYGQDITNSKIFITGLAFKGQPETDDLRGSPILSLINALVKNKTHNIFGHDFIVKDETIAKLGLTPITIEAGFKDAVLIIIGNNHCAYQKLNILKLVSTMRKPAIFYDSWRLYDKKQFEKLEGIHYEGIGLKSSIRKYGDG